MIQNEPHSTLGAQDSRNLQGEGLQAEVDRASAFGLFPAIEVEALADRPITMLVSPRGSESKDNLSGALGFIAKKLLGKRDNAQSFLFRGVKLTRLSQVTTFGCDVAPTTAPLFASESAQKALEYGDIVMVFDPARLERSFKKVRKSESPEILHQLREEYLSETEAEEDWLWFSRLPPGDGRIRTVYETHYSFFIPGNPHEALLMIFLIGDDRNALRAEFLGCKGRTRLP